MNYEMVELKEKTMVGLSTETSNSDPNMGMIIGKLWENFYKNNIDLNVKNKVNDYSIGLYSDYHDDKYDVTVGNEVSKVDNPELTVKVIPGGKYAKFSVHGNMQKVVATAWGEIWKMDLNRSFTGDFEEYRNADMDNADIDIYVALK